MSKQLTKGVIMRSVSTALMLGLGLLLAGCAGAAAAPAAKPTATPGAAPTSVAPTSVAPTSVAPTASEQPAAEIPQVTCENILPAESLDYITGLGYELEARSDWWDPMSRFVANDGVACWWVPPGIATDNVFVFGYSPISDDEAAKVHATLDATLEYFTRVEADGTLYYESTEAWGFPGITYLFEPGIWVSAESIEQARGIVQTVEELYAG